VHFLQMAPPLTVLPANYTMRAFPSDGANPNCFTWKRSPILVVNDST